MPRPTNSADCAGAQASAASRTASACVSKIHWICSAVSPSSWNSMRAWRTVILPFTCASNRASSVRLTIWPMKLLVDATAISLFAFV